MPLLLLLLLHPFAHADIPLGALAGGELKAVHSESREDGEVSGTFSVVWKKGKAKKSVQLEDYSMPEMGGDAYSLQAAKRKGNEITVVVERQGAYDYRGNDRTTYRVSFDPERLRFSKVRSSAKSDQDEAVEKLEKFFRRHCDPLAVPDDDFVSETVTASVRNASAVMKDAVFTLYFEAMHACAQEAFRKGDKARARQLAMKTLESPPPGKDWICLAEEVYEKPPPCKPRKEIFLETFVKERTAQSNDLGFFLDGDPTTRPMAKEVLAAVVQAAPKRAVTRLNYADVLWELGDKAAAKEQYREYLKLSSGSGKEARKAREKAGNRLEKPSDLR